MRFGAAVRDKAEIHALLDARRDGLLDRLDQLDGACEMALRIAPQNPIATPTDQAPTNPSPLAYLERRRSYYQQADAAAELNCPMERQFLERLYGLFRDWRKLSPGPAHLTRLALLVDRNHVAALRLRAANSFRAGDSSRCQVLGPWPPYSFV
jgi:hypothetical protein